MSLLARQLLLRRCTAAAASSSRSPRPLVVIAAPRPPRLVAAMSSSGGAGGGGAPKQQAPEVDALALFTGPGAQDLRGQSCSIHGCSAETPRVPDADLSRFLAALPAWRLSSDGSSLSRRFVARNFVAALAYLNLVGELAESERHHPDLHITDYRTVEVVVATHEGGARVTMADLVLAAKIDALPWSDYSPKWLREQQAASGGG